MSAFRYPSRFWSPTRQNNLALPQSVPVPFRGFSGGLDLSDRPEDVAENSSPDCSDVEVTEQDELIRQEGIQTVESFVGRTILHMRPHFGLDARTELLMFAPPFIGVKRDVGTVWTDHGLDPEGGFVAATNHGGTLLFTDGRAVYTREAFSDSIQTREDVPIARSYVSFAGRVFALDVNWQGAHEASGIVWSAANSLAHDFDSTGTGYELLIAEQSFNDRGIALKSMNLDMIAILMRRSIWIGRRTGLVDRPASFEPRVQGAGAVNAATAQVTPYGVLFLSDDGVRIFDGNQAVVISQKINKALLPLDYENLDGYSSLYDPQRSWYYLFTPSETWILDLSKQRWYRKSVVVQHAAMFADQEALVTWESFPPGTTWEDLAGQVWEDYIIEEGPIMYTYFIADVAGTPTLGLQTTDDETYYGTVVRPYWRFRVSDTPLLRQMVTVKAVTVEYDGFGTIEIMLPNVDGDMVLAVTEALAIAGLRRVTEVPMLWSGRGLGLTLRIMAGDPAIKAVDMEVVPRSKSVKQPDFITREYESQF